MTNPIVPDAIPVGSTGKNLNATQVTTTAGVVDNEVVTIGDPSNPVGLAIVENNPPSPGDMGLTVRQATDYSLNVYDRAQDENINGTADYPDPWYPKEQQDLFDVSLANPLNFTPLQTSLAGIDTTGKTFAAQSFPVTLALEDSVDQWLVSAPTPTGTGTVGINVLSPVAGNTRPALDCLQYRSISFQTNTGIGTTVTLVFEGSNDGANFVGVTMFDVNAPSTLPVNTVAQAAATSRYWAGPLVFRYFRARVTTAVSGGGLVAAFTRLSMAPFATNITQVAQSTGNWSSNIAQYGGSAVVTGGLAGVTAVGGNIAVAATPTTNPVVVGGTDGSVTNAGAANPLIRRVLTDTTGAQIMVGPQTPLTTTAPLTTSQPVLVAGTQYSNSATQQPVIHADQNTTQANERINEILAKILLEMKGVNFYLKELSLNLNQGITTTDEFVASTTDDITVSNINLN